MTTPWPTVTRIARQITEEMNLSQRTVIMTALLKAGPIVVWDEDSAVLHTLTMSVVTNGPKAIQISTEREHRNCPDDDGIFCDKCARQTREG